MAESPFAHETMSALADQVEIDPHETYLDAVFAKIDRIRHIDASVLTEKYGIDPAVLSPLDDEARSSWPVERLLADADAQREELREHLDGLVAEFIADGLSYDTAVAKSHETLGDPGVLVKQISRVTAQNALKMDGPWHSVLRRNCTLYDLAIPYIPALLILLVPSHALFALGLWSCLAALYGMRNGYALGYSLSPELRQLVGRLADDLKSMLSLPTVQPLSLRQRIARIHVRKTILRMKRIYRSSEVDEGVIWIVGTFICECLGVGMFVMWLSCMRTGGAWALVILGLLSISSVISLGRTCGLYLGAGRRSRLTRRAS